MTDDNLGDSERNFKDDLTFEESRERSVSEPPEDLVIENDDSPASLLVREYEDALSLQIRRNTNLQAKLAKLESRVAGLKEGYDRLKKDNERLKQGEYVLKGFSDQEIKDRGRKRDIDFSDRPLPCNISFEQTILGVLIRDSSFLPLFRDLENPLFKKLEVSCFHSPSHGIIFKTMCDIGPGFDLVSLTDELDRRGLLDEAGGPKYLSELFTSFESVSPGLVSVNYVERLLEYGLMRAGIKFSIDTMTGIYEMNEKSSRDIFGYLFQRASEMIDLIPKRQRADLDMKGLAEVVQQDFEEHVKRGYKPKYSTGYPELDRLTHGIGPGFIICGARTKHGKTSLALNIARNLHLQGQRSLYFSRETSPRTLTQKLVSMVTGVNSEIFKYADNPLSDEERESIRTAFSQIKNYKIEYDRVFDVNHIIARAQVMKRRFGDEARFVVIDSIQSFDVPDKTNKAQHYEEVGKKLQNAIVDDLGLCLWINSQLTSEADKTVASKRHGPNPAKSLLSDCEALGEEADQTFYCYNPAVYFPNEEWARDTLKIIPYRRRIGGVVDEKLRDVKLLFNPRTSLISSFKHT